MEAVRATPLLDCFRQGGVPKDVRLLAAEGGLAPRASEQLAILALLTRDPDSDVVQAAEATLAALPPDGVAAVLSRREITDEIRAFFKVRGIDPAAVAADGESPLVDAESGASPGDEAPDHAGAPARAPISSLAVPARLKMAMKGTREQRAVLIRDPNKIVAAAVLSSPKLSDTEVETFARMSNVSDEVLRVIGTSRTWISKQAVAVALVKNPKTPPTISLSLLTRMVPRDVKMLVTDRNLPEVLRLAARKLLTTQDARRQ